MPASSSFIAFLNPLIAVPKVSAQRNVTWYQTAAEQITVRQPPQQFGNTNLTYRIPSSLKQLRNAGLT